MKLAIIIAIIILIIILLIVYAIYRYNLGSPLTYSYDGTTYSEVEYKNPFGSPNFSINFDIKVHNQTNRSIIMELGDPGPKCVSLGPCDPYCYITLIDDYITFSFITQDIPPDGYLAMDTSAGTIKLNNNLWHNVVISRSGSTWSIVIDGKQQTSKNASSDKVIKPSKLFLANTTVTIPGPKGLDLTKFKGCIRNFSLNNELITDFIHIGNVEKNCL